MSQSASNGPSRGSLATLSAFMLGVPLGMGVLWLLHYGPLQNEEVKRYTRHEVEQAEVILFCCALMAIAAKLLGYFRERKVFGRDLLPRSAKPQAASEATNLLNHLEVQRGWRGAWLGQRIHAILEFVRSRGSANELDDQLRTLADNDIAAQEGGYALLRFINWAIPILGFLGTVVGITQAIGGVDPEAMNLTGVTNGLSTAFDATALALALTMVLMFGTLCVERLEQSILENVDTYVERNLAHRFERTGAENGQFIDALKKNTDVLLGATQHLVERQAQVWSKSLEKLDKRWSEIGKAQEAQLTGALGQALEFALRRYGERLADLENKLQTRNEALVTGLTGVAQAIEETGRQHRDGLADIAIRLGAQADALIRLQEGESQLVRLQETLQQNLAAIAGAGAFDEAVQSLTAAIHLLTSRVQPGAAPRKVA
jgi:biopolymer transport protein ExbB/TolQ